MASRIYNISSEVFAEYVKNSSSFTEILRKCDLENKGGNINTVKRRINKENLDYSHIKTGFGHNAGRTYPLRRISKEEALERIFTNSSKTSRDFIKLIICRYSLKEYKCSECQLGDIWNEKKISLQLDHINGINDDNRLENLRFLCPNCHSQTETYCGKSSRKKKYYCIQCGIETKGNSEKCSACSAKKNRKVERPNKEILQKEVLEQPFTKLGEKYGVSDNAVRKWCKSYDITIPYSLGYWSKQRAKKINS